MRLPILLLAAMAAACSPQGAAGNAPPTQAAQTVHPVSGLRVVPLTVTSGKTVHNFTVEVADTDPAQRRGLMFRTELAPDEGMVFLYPVPQVLGFWMKNTPLPLDIIFIDADRRVLNIAAQTTPYSLDSVYSDGPAMTVLELAGGRAAELGIAPGDTVSW